ncbi:methyltransferase domain-containing protein [Pseudoduganella sp. R-43]|uniref:methyltransferase domain-containing protein n=1 Tax=unclassified Pseudoduganella TaxID=2637179 RepID=UPI003CEBCCDF
MKFTGERFIPESSVDGELEHIHRYLLARELVAGKRVLDIACGEGYGSQLLAERAAQVSGVDIAAETVDHARATYGAGNLEFLLGDCAAIPFEAGTFDVVVSFETIEHHDQHEKMISEIRRVLKPDGILVISSPDKRYYSDERGYVNQFHVKELYRDEFVGLLRNSFANVELYSQRLLYGSAILAETVAQPGRTYGRADGDFSVADGVRAPLYLIAVAGAGALPALPHGVYETPIESSDAFKEMLRSAAERDGMLEATKAAFDDRDGRLAQATSEIERLSSLISEVSGTLVAVVADRDFQRDGLAKLVGERDAFAQRLTAVQAEREEQAREMAATLAAVEERTRQLADSLGERDGQLRQLAATVGERDSQLRQLNEQLGDRHSHLLQANTALGEREGQLRQAEAALGERDARLRQAHEALDACNSQLRQAAEMLGERDQQLRQLTVELAERASQIGQVEMARSVVALESETRRASMEQLQARIAQLDSERASDMVAMEAKLKERDAMNDKLAAAMADLYRSKSWRVTAPLRAMTRLLGKVKRRANLARQAAPSASAAAAVPLAANPAGAENKPFRILLVSYYCPTRAHAGGLRILDMYALIRQKCPHVQIDLLTHHRPSIDWSIDDLPKIFHNVYLSPVEDLTPLGLAALRGSVLPYDVVDLQFHQSGYHIDAFRAIGGKILFTPMEAQTKVLLLDLRAKFSQSYGMRLLKFASAIRTAAVEIGFTQKADDVVCVSRADAAFLRAVTGSHHIRWVDTGVSSFEFAEALTPGFVPPPAAERTCRVLYVAYFGSETNVNALRWYLDHVHPQIKASVPGYVLTVVGRGDMTPFAAYHDESIEFVGEVPAIAPHIADARVCIAPALSGSGFRGKVNQYAVLGCPSVVSPIAAKGLAYQDGIDVFIAETPQAFAQRCVQLLTDMELNDRMGQAARKLCMERYSWESKWPVIRRLYQLENQA